MEKQIKLYSALALLVILVVAVSAAVFYLAQVVGANDCTTIVGRLPCDTKDVAKAINDARSSFLQVFVGLAGLGALYFSWRNYTRTVRDSNETQALARESRVSDNFIKAVEQLGNQVVHVRVGGVYGLGRLLRSAELQGDYWPIIDVLAAFARETGRKTEDLRKDKPPEDLKAAMNVLARRSATVIPWRQDDSPADLHGTDLSQLWLAGGHFEWGYFSDCDFTGSDLSGVNFTGGLFPNADFTKAISLESMIIDGADLSKALILPSQLKTAKMDKNTKLPFPVEAIDRT